MKIIHEQWQLVGKILVVDDDGNAQVLGKDEKGQEARATMIVIPVARFRGNELSQAYQKARQACEEIVARFQAAPPLAIVPNEDAHPSPPESDVQST